MFHQYWLTLKPFKSYHYIYISKLVSVEGNWIGKGKQRNKKELIEKRTEKKFQKSKLIMKLNENAFNNQLNKIEQKPSLPLKLITLTVIIYIFATLIKH